MNETAALAIAAVAVLAAIWISGLKLLPFADDGSTVPLPNVDEFYHALLVRDYRQAPLGMLSFAIGHLWTWVFGESLMGLRMLCWICVELSIAMGCLYLWRRSRRPLLSAVTFAIMTLTAVVSGNDNYDWYTGSYPWLVGECLLLLSFLHRPMRRRLVWIGIIGAAMTMSRVTLVCLLPVVLVAVAWRRRRHGWMCVLADWLLIIVPAMLTVAALAVIMCGSVEGYMAAWNADNIISGHSSIVKLLSFRTTLSSVVIVSSLPTLLIALTAPVVSRLRRYRAAAAVAAGVLAGALMIRIFGIETILCTGLRYYLSALGGAWVAMLLAPWVNNMIAGRSRVDVDRWVIYVAFLFPVCAALGSDVMVARFFLMPFVPMLMAALLPAFPRFIRWNVAMWAVAIPIVFLYVAVWGNRREILSAADYSGYPLIGSIRHADPSPTAGVIAGLTAEYDSLRQEYGDCIVAVGQNKYAVDYLCTDGTGYALNQFHAAPEYADEVIARLTPVADGAHPVVYVAFDRDKEADGYLYRFLASRGYSRVKPTHTGWIFLP